MEQMSVLPKQDALSLDARAAQKGPTLDANEAQQKRFKVQ